MYPSIYSLEVTLGCNLHCVECAIGANMVDRRCGVMSYENFKVIADKIKPYCKYLYLHLWGEPLINPDIIKIIECAATFTRANISTNANMIDDAYAERLINSGVSDIIVSIDGVTQDVYAHYRRGGNVEKALHGLSVLSYHAKKKNNSLFRKVRNRLKPSFATGRVNVIPQFVVFDHNYHEMEKFSAICKKLGLTVSFKSPYIRANSSLSPCNDDNYVRHRASTDASRTQAMRACSAASEDMTILLSGDVIACCYDHNGHICFGNIFEQSVEEIWNSSNYADFRAGLIAGTQNSFCLNHCLLY